MCSNMFNATYIDSVTFDNFFQNYYFIQNILLPILFNKILLFRHTNYFPEFIVKNFLKIIRNYAVFNVTNAARSIPYFYIVF